MRGISALGGTCSAIDGGTEVGKTLHDLAMHIASINREIEANDGELTPGVAEALDSIAGSFDRKVDVIRLLTSRRRSRANWHREQARLHTSRAVAMENASDRWDEWVMRGMDAAALEVAGTVIPLRIVANGGYPSIRWVRDGEPIPEPFQVISTTVSLNVELAREAAKLNALPDGFEVKRGRHLRAASVDTKRRKRGVR